METMLRQEGEGFCLEGLVPSIMRYAKIEKGSVQVWHENRDSGIITNYDEGRDFCVNYERGLLARTRDSAIPDYRTALFYGVTPFDYLKFPAGEWGNSKITVYANYNYCGAEDERPEALARNNFAEQGFTHLDLSKFRTDPIRYLVFGDSISEGGDAYPAEKAFFFLFADELKKRTGKNVTVENRAIGGENTRSGLERFERDVLSGNFDLISIAYGMNDHSEINGRCNGILLDEYEENLRKMTKLLDGKAQILLANFCYPNDRSCYSGTKTREYAESVRRLGLEYRLPVADLTRLWEHELEAGKTHKDLLLNDINHPNNYGHRLYAAAFSAVIEVK